MKKNLTIQKKIDRGCRRVSDWSESYPVLWEFTRGILAIVPAAILAFVAFRFDEAKTPSLVRTLRATFQDSPVALVALILLPGLLVLALNLAVRRAQSLDKEELDGPEMMTVLTSIDKFVKSKLERFANLAASLEHDPAAGRGKGDVFENITQPQAQIREIVLQIHMVLQALTTDDTLKVVLVEVPGKGVSGEPQYECCSPSDQPPTKALLTSLWKKSFFYDISKLDGPKTISDIRRELKKRKNKKAFAITKADKIYEGSIIGYPLHNPFLDRLTHVMTIRSTRVNHLNTKFERVFSKYLEFFFTRIHLEYSLKIIKHAST